MKGSSHNLVHSLYGQKDRVLDIWPVLSESPLIHYMGYSPLIHAAFDINRELVTSLPISEPYYACSALPSAHTTTAGASRTPQRCSDPYTPIPGLLALHLRRGDFEGHCAHLAKWGAAWAGFNSFPMFPDQWVTPEGSGWGETTEEGLALYMKRCYPDVSQIVAKIKEVRKTPAARGIKDIYIMTNGKAEWLAELKTAIKAMGGWNKIASSRDLVITKEQKEVAQAIDMMIGERAQMIIGNGVCLSNMSLFLWPTTDSRLTSVVEYDLKYCDDADGERATTGKQSLLVM